MKNKIPIIFALFLMILTGSFEQILACSCVPTAPCQSYGSSDVAFVGKAIGSKYQRIADRYETINEGTENETTISKKITYDVGEIYFEVIEAFNGVQKGSEITINSSTGGGDCGFWFERGKTYVVFASREDSDTPSGISSQTFGGNVGEEVQPKKNRLWTTICSGTREIKDAEETLNYLRNFPKVGSGGVVVGQIYESIKDYSNENLTGKPFTNVQVKAKQVDGNNQTFFGTTDENGYFEIKVPVGNYFVTPVLQNNLISSEEYQEDGKPVKIEDQRCKVYFFRASNDSEVSGKVINSDGSLAKGISLDLIPFGKNREDRTFDRKYEYIGEDGLFSFKGIPLGKYQISINYADKPEDDSPYPTFFYPKTASRDQAKVFEIDYGTKFTDLVLQLPAKLKKRKFFGTVVWKNGKPAVGAEVQLRDLEFERDAFFAEPKTNSKGEFSMEWFEGRKYKIEVIVWKRSPDGQSAYGVASAESEAFILDDKTGKFKIVLDMINPEEKSINRTTVRSN